MDRGLNIMLLIYQITKYVTKYQITELGLHAPKIISKS